MGYFSMVFVSFVAIKQCLLYGVVYQRVFDVSLSKHFFYVEYVFGFVVFHGGFPVSEGVEGYPSGRGLLSFLARRFLASVKVDPIEAVFAGWNISSDLDMFKILSTRFWLTWQMRSLLPFSGSLMIMSLL